MSANSGGARASWSGKWAFILAAAASAIGLGNLWRFPYLAAKYGGGVFLITYVVLVVTFGFTLMMLEAALGRKTGQSALGAFKSFGKKYAFIGIFTSAIPFIIVPYYCIIGGWSLSMLVPTLWMALRRLPMAARTLPTSSAVAARASSGLLLPADRVRYCGAWREERHRARKSHPHARAADHDGWHLHLRTHAPRCN